MDLRVLSLIGSAVLNATLLGALVVRPSLAPPSLRPFLPSPTVEQADATPRRPAARPLPASAKPAAELWPALHSQDLRTLVERLRAAGFPPALVRAIIDAEVERQFAPRIAELLKAVNETPYWKPDTGYYSGNTKLFEAVSQIYRERGRVLRDLLGQDAYAYAAGVDASAALRRQYGNLSQAKIDLVQRINEDYAEMTGQIRSAMQGVTLPEDREKLALLEREKRADLAAVLTPEELAEYEMRTSQITSRLRASLTILDASDAEFRAIYDAHQAHKDTLYPAVGVPTVFTQDLMEKRRDATRQVNDQIKAALGEKRFAEYQRASDSDFQQLYRLGQRDNVPYDTVVRAFDIRAPTAEASLKIVDNPALSADDKRAALRDLAQEARTKLLSTLGPSAGPAYVANSRWLLYLDQGRGITIMPDGSISSRMAAPPASSRPPQPKS